MSWLWFVSLKPVWGTETDLETRFSLFFYVWMTCWEEMMAMRQAVFYSNHLPSPLIIFPPLSCLPRQKEWSEGVNDFFQQVGRGQAWSFLMTMLRFWILMNASGLIVRTVNDWLKLTLTALWNSTILGMYQCSVLAERL